MNLRTRWRTALVFASAAVTACASPTAPAGLLTVSTTAPAFARDSLGFARISFRMSNSGERTIYVPRCGTEVSGTIQSANERLSGIQALSAACVSSLYIGPLGIEAGQTVMSTQTLRVPPGEYQISMPVSFNAGDAPTGASRSAFFRIE
jgi:hypothetical protein